MKKIIVVVCLTLIFSCRTKNEEAMVADARITAITDSLSKTIDKIYQQGHVNGFSVAIVNDSAILYNKGFGLADIVAQKPYTKNTVQNIASISKTFIGVSLLKAQELGKLKLDDPINNYLSYEVINPHYPEVPITIRHLATHTSSILDTDYYGMSYVMKDPLKAIDTTAVHIPDYFNGPETRIPLPDFLEKILSDKGAWYQKEGFLNNPPGAHYEYSNVAATLAAQVLEEATGVSFPKFSQTHILDPLGMTGSGWSFDAIHMEDHSRLYADTKTPLPFYSLITYPDGGFTTSSSDLAKYLLELIKGQSGQGTLLQAASYAELFKKQLNASHYSSVEGEKPSGDEHNAGIFMGFMEDGQMGHSGGDPGISSFMFFDPKTQLGRILVVNTDLNEEGYKAFLGLWETLAEYGGKLNQ
jgi:CubicO group peptidase (beta-lactamase class C family)